MGYPSGLSPPRWGMVRRPSRFRTSSEPGKILGLLEAWIVGTGYTQEHPFAHNSKCQARAAQGSQSTTTASQSIRAKLMRKGVKVLGSTLNWPKYKSTMPGLCARATHKNSRLKLPKQEYQARDRLHTRTLAKSSGMSPGLLQTRTLANNTTILHMLLP
jgi:hypothetical protein